MSTGAGLGDLLRPRGDDPHCPATLAIRRTVRGVDFTEAARLGRAALSEPACGQPLCLWRAMISLIAAGDLVTAGDHVDRLPGGPMHALVRFQIARRSGDLAQARDTLARLPDGTDDVHVLAKCLLADVLAESGAVTEPQQVLRSIGAQVPAIIRPYLLAARAAVHSAAGRNLAACLDFLAGGRDLLALGITNTAVMPWRGKAALAARAIGRGDVALRLATEDLAAARRWGEPSAVGAALATLGRVRGDDGTALLTDAIDLLHVAGARHELAGAHLELGHRLAARGDTCAARGSFASAQTLAAHTGQARQARDALALLTSPGTRTLTRQEELVASLAEAGLANRAIAARLHLTVHTVEVHLSNVYRKLGVTGRGRLAGALRAHTR